MNRTLRWAAALACLAGGAQAQAPSGWTSDDAVGAGGIVGRVCRDLDGDGRCGDDEPGIPGARVVLETGQEALCDARGRYHLAAVSARDLAPAAALGALSQPHLLPGRHRLTLDARHLPPGSRVATPALTVEVPLAGLVLQDFAVAEAGGALSPLRPAPDAAPPSGRMEKSDVLFTVTGQAGPQDRVRVAGVQASVTPDGTFRAEVPLHPGRNELSLEVASPGGTVRFFTQHIDVLPRSGGVLVVPREIRSAASVKAPSAEGQAAATGPTSLAVDVPAGTKVRFPGGEVTAPQSGTVQVPVVLKGGANEIALDLEAPGSPPTRVELSIPAEPRPLVVGLLDLEGGVQLGGGLKTAFTFTGRAAAHAEVPLGAWRLTGELELRDQDLDDWATVRGRPGATGASEAANLLLGQRRADVAERALDPLRYQSQWGDDSAGAVANPGEARLRAELSHPELGRVGLGTSRAQLVDGEVGRYQRELFGPFVDLHTPAGMPVQLRGKGFAAPGWVDPVVGAASAPSHDELHATGGSVYYLSSQEVIQGSEVVRVEIRDGISGVPVAERHLVRGRDYEVSYLAGRILLARPLSFLEGTSALGSLPLTSNPEPVLVVDYEHVTGALRGALAGGELEASFAPSGAWDPMHLSAGAVDQAAAEGSSAYRLWRARANLPIGWFTLSGEYAHSAGLAIAPGDFGVSDDGGLSFLRPDPLAPAGAASGFAWGVRLKGNGWGEANALDKSFVDASYRARSPGFSDGAHAPEGFAFHQATLRVQQNLLGNLYLGLLGDDLEAPDPRDPYGAQTILQRNLGLAAGWRAARWEARVEARDSRLTAATDPYDPAAVAQTGGRTSAALFGRYRLNEWLAAVGSYNQVLAQRGAGLGRYDNTFASAGVEVSPEPDATIGIRGGWGPVLGPQAWVDGQLRQGAQTHYGAYSVDVDGPDVGQRRMVSGARTQVGDSSSVFVEDVSAHDATSIRLSRAVGLTEGLADGLEVTGRYERGVRAPLELVSPLLRDSAGATATFVRKRFRLSARAEYRFERGQEPIGPPLDVRRVQWLASGSATVELLDNLRASGRINASQTLNLGLLEARFLEAGADLAWRSGPLAVLLHYGAWRDLPPPTAPPFVSPLQGESSAQVVSVKPALRLGERLAVGGGLYATWFSVAGQQWLVLSASLRPSVRVVGGLEVAAEVARRSSAPGGGELGAVRAEAGYHLGEQFLMALGGTVLGYQGLDGDLSGISHQPARLYVRAEAAY